VLNGLVMKISAKEKDVNDILQTLPLTPASTISAIACEKIWFHDFYVKMFADYVFQRVPFEKTRKILQKSSNSIKNFANILDVKMP